MEKVSQALTGGLQIQGISDIASTPLFRIACVWIYF